MRNSSLIGPIVGGVGVLALLAGVFSLIVGWFMNIFAIAGMLGGPITTELVVRVIGLFVAPLGGILGWVG